MPAKLIFLKTMIIAQTSRLVIRQYSADEEPLFLDILTDKRVTDYLPKRNPEEISKIFNDTLNDYEQDVKLTRWGVFNKADNEFIGFGMLKATTDEPSHAELGYVIHDKFKGMGIATEVAVALLNYGFTTRHLTTIFAVTNQANIPSQKVLLKAGFKQGENILRNDMWLSYFDTHNHNWSNAKY